MRRLKLLVLAAVAALALHAAPAFAQAQPPVKGPGAFKGTFDSYKSELGPPASTGDCPGDKVAHNNAGANLQHNYDVPPSNTVVSAELHGPSTGAAHNDSYLTNGGVPGHNPFGIGTAKYGPSSGLVTAKRSSASVKDSDTVNEPCRETAEGTLN